MKIVREAVLFLESIFFFFSFLLLVFGNANLRSFIGYVPRLLGFYHIQYGWREGRERKLHCEFPTLCAAFNPAPSTTRFWDILFWVPFDPQGGQPRDTPWVPSIRRKAGGSKVEKRTSWAHAEFGQTETLKAVRDRGRLRSRKGIKQPRAERN